MNGLHFLLYMIITTMSKNCNASSLLFTPVLLHGFKKKIISLAPSLIIPLQNQLQHVQIAGAHLSVHSRISNPHSVVQLQLCLLQLQGK